MNKYVPAFSKSTYSAFGNCFLNKQFGIAGQNFCFKSQRHPYFYSILFK
jgi:hypothetical protein